ncbi:hypothetical protein O2W18_20815 [Modestobacter sp. VKM Ac-2983]|uniref:hypothetical protein n=1 Tax=Modestobacter sp. VKM Ac-2983 TaxID=3004137 RepID=UPI0022AB5B55|nr:hypothetical protein [Modestobacter sp. VKM Ac-2983]MCZ2807555.1 hypothetical protein [Modestobacter sp. VKM Ac-2983]
MNSTAGATPNDPYLSVETDTWQHDLDRRIPTSGITTTTHAQRPGSPGITVCKQQPSTGQDATRYPVHRVAGAGECPDCVRLAG